MAGAGGGDDINTINRKGFETANRLLQKINTNTEGIS